MFEVRSSRFVEAGSNLNIFNETAGINRSSSLEAG